jgi:uncharacterized protein YoxC
MPIRVLLLGLQVLFLFQLFLPAFAGVDKALLNADAGQDLEHSKQRVALQECQRMLSETETELAMSESKYKKICDDQIQSLNQTIEGLKQQNSGLSGQVQNLNSEINKLTNDLKSREFDNKNLKQQIAQCLADLDKCKRSILGPLLGVPVGTVVGGARGGFQKAKQHSKDFSQRLGGGLKGDLVGSLPGMVFGAVTGSASGMVKGMVDGVVIGYKHPWTLESISAAKEFDPYEFIRH